MDQTEKAEATETAYSRIISKFFDSIVLLLFGIPALGIAVPSLFEGLNYYTLGNLQAQNALLDCFAILYFLAPVLFMLGIVIVFLKGLDIAFRNSIFVIILAILVIGGIYFLLSLAGTSYPVSNYFFWISCLLTGATAVYFVRLLSFNCWLLLTGRRMRSIYCNPMNGISINPELSPNKKKIRRISFDRMLSPKEKRIRRISFNRISHLKKIKSISFLFLIHLLLSTCLIYCNAIDLEADRTWVKIEALILFLLAVMVYAFMPLLIYFKRSYKRDVYLSRSFVLSWLLIVFITLIFFIPVLITPKPQDKEVISPNNIKNFVQKAWVERQSAWIYDSLTQIGSEPGIKTKQLWLKPVNADSFNLLYKKDNILAVQELVSCLSQLSHNKDQKAGLFLLNRLIANEERLKQIDSKKLEAEKSIENDRRVDELWGKVKKLQRTGIYISLISFVLLGLFLIKIKPLPFSRFRSVNKNIRETRKYCQVVLIIALLFFVPLLKPIPRAAISLAGSWPFKLQNWNLKELISPSNSILVRGGRGGAGGQGVASGQGGAGGNAGGGIQSPETRVFFIQGVDTSQVDIKDLVDQLSRSVINDSAFKEALLDNNAQYQIDIGDLHRQLDSSIKVTRNQTSALNRKVDTVAKKLDTSLGNLKDAINGLTRESNRPNP